MIRPPDNVYLAVLDACVLAPMPLCDTLLRCAEEPALFRPLWSSETLAEVSRTLIKFGYSRDQAERRIRRMQEAFPEAKVVIPPGLIDRTPWIPDPGDRHVVAAAIHEGAHVIVTANLKHFPRNLLAPHGILVHRPDDFLIHQYHLRPERILEVLDTQAKGIRLQRQHVLAKLENSVPNFVKLVGEGRR